MGNCSVQRANNYGSGLTNTGEVVQSERDCGVTIHEGSILGLAYATPNKLLTCSDDKRIAVVDTIQLLTNKSYTPNYLLGHTKAVNRIITTESNAWSASRDLSLRMVRACVFLCIMRFTLQKVSIYSCC